MAHNRNPEDSSTDRPLAALRAPDGFQPNAAAARMRLTRKIAESQTPGRMRKWIWSAVTAGVLLAAMLTIPATRASARIEDRPAFSLHEIMAPVHRFFARSIPYLQYHWHALTGELTVGFPAPDFELADENGNTVQLSDYRGKVVLVNFWATWCVPCTKEMPWLAELQQTYRDDLVVLGVSMDQEGWSAIRPFLAQHPVNYPILLGGDRLPQQYRNIESVPASVLVSREGRVGGTSTALATKAIYEAWIVDMIEK